MVFVIITKIRGAFKESLQFYYFSVTGNSYKRVQCRTSGNQYQIENFWHFWSQLREVAAIWLTEATQIVVNSLWISLLEKFPLQYSLVANKVQFPSFRRFYPSVSSDVLAGSVVLLYHLRHIRCSKWQFWTKIDKHLGRTRLMLNAHFCSGSADFKTNMLYSYF